MTPRTFVSAYRYDPVRVLFVRRVLPVFVWVSVLGALLVPVLVLANLWQGVAEEARPRFLLLLGGMALLMLSAPAVMQWALWYIRRDLFETEWQLDATGLTRRRGGQVVHRRWGQVRGLDKVGIGRVQVARVLSDAGNLWFDAALIEHSGTVPRLRWGATRMTICWPDGRERPLTIEASELYRAIAARLSTGG